MFDDPSFAARRLDRKGARVGAPPGGLPDADAEANARGEAAAPLPPVRRGRGVSANPVSRFRPIELEPDLEAEHEAWQRDGVDDAPEGGAPPAGPPRVPTLYLEDHARSAISWNDSPDVGFEASINPYRGCEHGCAYCYARPFHEYLGLGAGLDFETRILVKRDLPAVLDQELFAPSWKPVPLAMCGVTDAYQPVERRLRLTRACLEVLARYRNPVGIVTKSSLVARDADVLQDLARDRAAAVWISLTTLDRDLQGRLEPRASTPRARLEAIRTLTQAGVPVGVLTAPVIPGLNDHELPSLLAAAAEAGARSAGYVVLRLPHGVEALFLAWLEQHLPLRKEKVLARLADMRGGHLTDGRFGTRMTGEGPIAESVRTLFLAGCRKAGLSTSMEPLSTAAFRRPERGQLSLFGSSEPA